ncbi:phosphate ABC transporter substrate-binding protein [uncultured Aquimarina sp.]|uniref:phosphate ABC transporter substrate-binding protein n=1 Tax=uncultured Aquimarina sp. TaxID=575652 RepID=UPI0026270415|nr:phosphate ABC transporter substrate-binding protein [uncultured Aquimarina sp.]
MKKFNRFKKAYGLNDYGIIDFPKKVSGIKISRIKVGEESGCSRCFPHGYETINCTIPERNWKSYRKKRWRKRA